MSYSQQFLDEEGIMKKLILAVLAATALGGCVAVPVYEPAPAVYYSVPAPVVRVYPAPPPVVYYRYSHRHHYRYYR